MGIHTFSTNKVHTSYLSKLGMCFDMQKKRLKKNHRLKLYAYNNSYTTTIFLDLWIRLLCQSIAYFT